MNNKIYRAIGLMSGTSLDGVDAALVETDGFGHVKPLGFYTAAYEPEVREKIRACLGRRGYDPDVREAEKLLTLKHAEAVKALKAEDVGIIGFHGQTILHDPDNRFTLQIGDGDLLARETGIDVISDFRSDDVKAGGQGAPFLPLYHRALAQDLEKPLAVLNIGGVSNLTWIGAGEEDILAFDAGPGNALIDDFVRHHTGQNFDRGGALARTGNIGRDILENWMKHPYFKKRAPKSLDRDGWDVSLAMNLSMEDGAATLTAFTAEAIIKGADLFPARARQFLVTGGGRHNRYLMDLLRARLNVPVMAVEHAGWNGDALEAEGFAYLAVRSLLGEALSLPRTTGVPQPQRGGRLHKAE